MAPVAFVGGGASSPGKREGRPDGDALLTAYCRPAAS